MRAGTDAGDHPAGWYADYSKRCEQRSWDGQHSTATEAGTAPPTPHAGGEVPSP
jgi:hypothetical protein